MAETHFFITKGTWQESNIDSVQKYLLPDFINKGLFYSICAFSGIVCVTAIIKLFPIAITAGIVTLFLALENRMIMNKAKGKVEAEMAKLDLVGHSFTVSFFEQLIVVSGNQIRTKLEIQYDGIERIVETETQFLLFTSSKIYIPVDKDSIDGPDWKWKKFLRERNSSILYDNEVEDPNLINKED